MQLFNQVKGYATAANAERKLRAVMGDAFTYTRWVIAINDTGRYVPVVALDNDNRLDMASLCQNGIAVIG